jgi:DNA-binding protein YbaB
MTEPSEEVQETLRRIQGQVEQSMRNAERMQELAAQIRTISTEVVSPGGELTVHVDVSGRLTNVVFTQGALALRPEQLTTVLLDALEEGYRRTSAESVALAADTLGGQSPTVTRLRDNVDEYAPQIERPEDGLIR